MSDGEVFTRVQLAWNLNDVINKLKWLSTVSHRYLKDLPTTQTARYAYNYRRVYYARIKDGGTNIVCILSPRGAVRENPSRTAPLVSSGALRSLAGEPRMARCSNHEISRVARGVLVFVVMTYSVWCQQRQSRGDFINKESPRLYFTLFYAYRYVQIQRFYPNNWNSEIITRNYSIAIAWWISV